ncbi:MAG: hypothetical protein E7598_02165 [Ruminococcaceae bacterium]|nr:hypothetical protein [Oscillospiraceae bacterium]
MKKIILLTLAAIFLFCACEKTPAEPADISTAEPPTITVATTIEILTDEIKASPSEIIEVEKLPYAEESAMFTGAAVGGNPRGFVFDIGTTYYVKRYFSAAEDDFAFYKCRLTLPEGYTNGRITGIHSGAGSGEVFIIVVAEKNNENVALEYLFYSETISEPISIRALEKMPESPINEPFKVTNNPANLKIKELILPLKGERPRICKFKYDERYMIYVTAEILKNDRTDFRSCAYDLFIIDKKTGMIVFKKDLNTSDTEGYPKRITYIDDGCIIHDITVEGDVTTTSCAYKISKAGEVFTVEATTLDAYPLIENKTASPSGEYIAWEKYIDGWGNGGIEVKYPDGSVKRILTNISLGNSPECKAKSIGDAIGYGIVGFVDDTHIAYSISGYEWLIGYGIYDLNSGKATEYREERDRAIAAHDGYVYVVENKYYEYEPYPDAVALYKMSLDGTKKQISNNPNASFNGAKWHNSELQTVDGLGRTSIEKVKILSLDFETVLAELEYVSVSGKETSLYIYDDTVTVILPQIMQ